jgi:hypothetical protein
MINFAEEIKEIMSISLPPQEVAYTPRIRALTFTPVIQRSYQKSVSWFKS